MEFEEFKAQVGCPVVIESPVGEVRARIASVDRLGDGTGGKRIPFSMVLRAPAEPLLEQGTYPLAINQLAMELFLVPIGPEGDQMCYEIVFN